MIGTFETVASYNYGYDRGEARRLGKSPPASPLGASSSWWIDVGDFDAASGRIRRTFKDGASYASTEEERTAYSDGYAGNSEPRVTGFDAWFAAGQRHKAQGLPKLYLLDVTVAPPVGPSPAVPGPVRPAPAYTPRPNPGADPMAPPVVVRAPPNGTDPAAYPSPIERGPIAPWMWPGGFGSGGGSGIILYGPGYYLDFSKMRPVGRVF